MNLSFKNVVAFFLVFAALSTVFGVHVFASQNQKSVLLPKNSVVQHDYFAAGNTVILSGTVNGDAYIAGGNVIVDGVINGDLLAAGGNVTIHGKVTQNVRAIGGNIIISGNVGRNVSVAGGNINVTDSAKINGDLVMAGAGGDVFGRIDKGITAAAGQLTVGNSVNGDILGPIGQLTFTPSAKIHGNVTYYSNARAQILQGATISGHITQKIPPSQIAQPRNNAFLRSLFFVITLADFISVFVIGSLLLKFFPFFTQRITDTITEAFVPSFVTGIIAFIIIPILSFVLLLTIIGIPLGIIVFFLYFLYLYLAKIFVANAIGKRISRGASTTHYLFIYLVGLLIYEIITFIPVVGMLFAFVAVATSIGSMLRTSVDFYHLLVTKELA